MAPRILTEVPFPEAGLVALITSAGLVGWTHNNDRDSVSRHRLEGRTGSMSARKMSGSTVLADSVEVNREVPSVRLHSTTEDGGGRRD